MSLQAIYFDMGGTIDTFRFTRQHRIENIQVIKDCLLRSGITLAINDEQLANMITAGAVAYTKWNMESNIELPPADIWADYFLKTLGIKREALQPIGEELAFLYETRLFIREMRPEIPRVLQQIKELGLTIGCISNTQSINQVPYNLESYGIIHYFDHIVLSSVYGRRKPDPAIFYYASRLANTPTSACAYVGDKINRDILGSKRAGYRLSIQIKHPYDNGEPDEGATPDAVIHSMHELLLILAQAMSDKTSFSVNRLPSCIKALFFDAGDILYFRPNKDAHLNLFLDGRMLNPVPDLDSEKSRLKQLAFTGQLKRHAYYEQVIRLYGITDPDDIAEGMQAISQDDNSVEIMAGVPETIRELKQRGFLLGIITDTAMPYSKKLNWFDQHGFGDVWDAIISSREMGMRKPAPSMYEMALSQVGVAPEQAVFIGHKQSELEGAKNVGMRTIAFNYEQNACADLYIDNFPDLLEIEILQKR
jgi:HAD superfamily hydrolase (TIGR01509 family)/HAD superfamily hydrolase (TIGR01549 family)